MPMATAAIAIEAAIAVKVKIALLRANPGARVIDERSNDLVHHQNEYGYLRDRDGW